ncbi:hypothetical protein ABIE67_001208 [Streptomyces sp. V4I8]
MATLLLLGAAGGALRGLLDVYNRFLDWQSDRRARLLSTTDAGEPPRFREYFDPVADPIAAVVHSAMGAAAAALFGTTGQVSGAYAAIVVGISAPVILTQLGRVQSIGDVANGAPSAGANAEAGTAVGSPRAASRAQEHVPAAPGSEPSVAATDSPAQPAPTVPASLDQHRRPTSTRPDFSNRDYSSPLFAAGLQTDSPVGETQPTGRPTDSADERRGGLGSHEAPRHPRRPSLGEEGTTR